MANRRFSTIVFVEFEIHLFILDQSSKQKKKHLKNYKIKY